VISIKKPLISVLIPTYNVDKYVEEAIRSIMEQTYKNLEIVIVDDCSTDKTYDILHRLAQEDIRIKLFRNDVNSKIVKTLNRAFACSHGEYIARMDGDDISKLDRIEKQYSFLLKNRHIDLVGLHVIGIDEKGNEINRTRMITNEELIYKTLTLASPILHIWLTKRLVYEKLNGYRELSGAEDYDFLLRMYSSGLQFINIDYYGYKLRLREGNTASASGLRQKKVARYIVKLFKQRLKTGNDSFSNENLEKELKSWNLSNTMYIKSAKLIKKAIFYKAKKEYIRMIFSLMLSVLISPYQMEYVLKKVALKIIQLQYKD